jgi:hypothetical protein
MSIWLGVLTAFVAVGTGDAPAPPRETPGKPVLIEGTWTYQGPRSIIGSSTDATVTLNKGDDGWTIGFVTTHFPSVNERGAVPRVERGGPFPVKVEDQELVFTRVKGNAPARYSFLCAPGRLIMPAIVQKKPGEWVYQSEDESFSLRCEHDPFQVPVGKAEAPRVPLGKGYYSYEEAPRSRLWPRARYLRFLERSDEAGQLCERFRLVFDDDGWPRYERLFETGERSTQDYQTRVYLAPKAKQ